MKPNLLWITIALLIHACGKPTNETVEGQQKATDEAANSELQSSLASKAFVDTEYFYSDSTGNNLIIQNSLPKGGLRYRDPTGKEYIYAVFWTRLINERDETITLSIDFPVDSIHLPSQPDRWFWLAIPRSTMKIEKAPMPNYGLEQLESVLDKAINGPQDVMQRIKPGDTYSFYVVTLFNQGVEGTVRAGLEVTDAGLHYRVNDKEIQAGIIDGTNQR